MMALDAKINTVQTSELNASAELVFHLLNKVGQGSALLETSTSFHGESNYTNC